MSRAVAHWHWHWHDASHGHRRRLAWHRRACTGTGTGAPPAGVWSLRVPRSRSAHAIAPSKRRAACVLQGMPSERLAPRSFPRHNAIPPLPPMGRRGDIDAACHRNGSRCRTPGATGSQRVCRNSHLVSIRGPGRRAIETARPERAIETARPIGCIPRCHSQQHSHCRTWS